LREVRSTTVTLLATACLVLGACRGDDGHDESVTGDGDTAPARTQGPHEAAPDAAPPEDRSPASGPGEGEVAGAPERAIRAAIEDAIASGDPDLACGEAVTDAYLRDAFGDAAGCRAAQSPGFAARAVEVGEISIDGDRARATARAQGGPYEGERLWVGLVREDEDWKLDRLRSNVPVGP
jgi:hypothetical protein